MFRKVWRKAFPQNNHKADGEISKSATLRAKNPTLKLEKQSASNGKAEENHIYDEVGNFRSLRSANWKSDPVLARNRKETFLKREKNKEKKSKDLDFLNKTFNEELTATSDAAELFESHFQSFSNFDEMKDQLENYEFNLQQAYGEIFILKNQLKQKQTELVDRCHHAVALKWKNRTLSSRLKEQELQVAELEKRLNFVFTNSWSTTALDRVSTPVQLCGASNKIDKKRLQNDSASNLPPNFQDSLMHRLQQAEQRCIAQEQQFNLEKLQWTEDKLKVIKYQKRLQKNYLQMCKRSDEFEAKLKQLSAKLNENDRLVIKNTDTLHGESSNVANSVSSIDICNLE